MSIVVCALVITFFTVVTNGPAGIEWKRRYAARRQAKQDKTTGRVTYLPSSALRPGPAAGRCVSPTCAICTARRSRTPHVLDHEVADGESEQDRCDDGDDR